MRSLISLVIEGIIKGILLVTFIAGYIYHYFFSLSHESGSLSMVALLLIIPIVLSFEIFIQRVKMYRELKKKGFYDK